jgi:ubiquinol-cytochrome c reductase cytochrome b/c1 subunit
MDAIGSTYKEMVKYPTPPNLSYNWNWGVTGLLILGIQVLTGILLVMHYVPSISYAFSSLEHLNRDVGLGWLLRVMHANGASFFFIVIYAHIIRGLFYGSYMYPRKGLWYTGIIIFLIMIITAFLGYILPWGQMSLWGATVITNLASAIPVIGDEIVMWLWGGFSVANPTLNKFFSLHYLLPFILIGMVIVHLVLLHLKGSSNPLGVNSNIDKTFFSPYYIVKDVWFLIIFLIVFVGVFTFMPDYLGHPDNYLAANSDVTPEHIVPEWYFLPFYAILRAIPDKTLGVIALLASLIVLFLLPLIHKSEVRYSGFKPITKLIVILFVLNCLLLGYLGMMPIEEPYLMMSKISTILYFIFFPALYLVEISKHLSNAGKKIIRKIFVFILICVIFMVVYKITAYGWWDMDDRLPKVFDSKNYEMPKPIKDPMADYKAATTQAERDRIMEEIAEESRMKMKLLSIVIKAVFIFVIVHSFWHGWKKRGGGDGGDGGDGGGGE